MPFEVRNFVVAHHSSQEVAQWLEERIQDPEPTEIADPALDICLKYVNGERLLSIPLETEEVTEDGRRVHLGKKRNFFMVGGFRKKDHDHNRPGWYLRAPPGKKDREVEMFTFEVTVPADGQVSILLQFWSEFRDIAQALIESAERYWLTPSQVTWASATFDAVSDESPPESAPSTSLEEVLDSKTELRKKDKDIVRMHYGGHSVATISRAVDLQVQTVMNKLSKFRNDPVLLPYLPHRKDRTT